MNRMILMAVCLLTVSNTYGDFKIINQIVESINYNNPTGTGVVNGMSFDIEFNEDRFIFTPVAEEAEEIVWENMPAMLSELDEFVMRSGKLQSNTDLASLSLGLLSGSGAQNELTIRDLLFQCHNSRSYDDPYDNLIASCTTKSVLQWSQFLSGSSPSFNEGAQAFKFAQAASSLFQTNKATGEIAISDVNLSILDNKLGGSFKMKVSGANRKIKVKGETHYFGDKKLVRVKIDSIKYLFINVTGQLFSELEQQETDKFIVDRPYIYIKLDK